MNARWFVTLPGGTLTDAHVETVVSLLGQCIADAGDGGVMIFDALQQARRMLEDIGLDWVVPKADYAGTFPKRVASWYRRNARPLLTAELQRVIGEIGARLGPQVNHGRTYFCDLVRHIDWDAGDFGDDGSCYWTTNKVARPALNDDPYTGALRFWSGDDDDAHGIARCWVTRCDEHVIVWNAYGLNAVTCARVLAAALPGYTYAKCDLVNNGERKGKVWINGDAHVLYPMSDDAESDYDLEIDLACPSCGNSDGECGECENCSERSCECGECDGCNHTRCECDCCSHCETSDWCNHCDRCNGCGRQRGE